MDAHMARDHKVRPAGPSRDKCSQERSHFGDTALTATLSDAVLTVQVLSYRSKRRDFKRKKNRITECKRLDESRIERIRLEFRR